MPARPDDPNNDQDDDEKYDVGQPGETDALGVMVNGRRRNRERSQCSTERGRG